MTHYLVARGFKGHAKRIDDIDLPRLGRTIGVGEDEIHAFMDVESAGSGFDVQGRPKMLFEPHIFFRNLSGAQQLKAVSLRLAYPKWGTLPYPRDSYPRLIQAMDINPKAALKSASWGLGQILGEHHAALGYADPESMVEAFMDDEEHHLAAMIKFLVKNGIDDDLRAHRWEAVARVYNGPGYAKNGYHTKLAAAYARWAKIADTPFQVDPPADIPRRNCVNLMTPAELAIREAVQAVEAVGADTRLTEAVVLLGKAQDRVADYVDDPAF